MMPINRHAASKALPGRLVRASESARLALRHLAAHVVSFESLFVLFLFSGACSGAGTRIVERSAS